MKSAIAECALLLMAVAVWAEPAFARTYLHCLTKKVVIVDAPRGSTSSSIEENFGFSIDEAEKTIMFADGTPLTVRRFDDRWISTARGDVSYELDRQNGNLAYASSTTKDGIGATTVLQYQQSIKQLERNGWNHEQVHRRNAVGMIAPPALRWRCHLPKWVGLRRLHPRRPRGRSPTLCMSGKQHSERRRGFGHDRLPVATGSPQALRIRNRE